MQSSPEVDLLYQVQYREPGESGFRDDDEWFSCDECIRRMWSLFAGHPQRDFRIVDDHGIVIATTVKKRAAGQPKFTL